MVYDLRLKVRTAAIAQPHWLVGPFLKSNYEMVEGGGVSSNTLFDILQDWNQVLSRVA